MTGIFLLLGSNMEDPLGNLNRTLTEIGKLDIDIIQVSSVYQSEPWGRKDQPWFLNAVIKIDTALEPKTLLKQLLQIETEMGRKRIQKWGPRIIDIDILYFRKEVVQLDDLIIPHPGIPDRKFTLMPLAEMEPNFVHPLLHKNQKQLLAETDDKLECHLTSEKLIYDVD